jgi:hypothetical protein
MGFKMKGSPVAFGPGLFGAKLISGIGKALGSLADNDERYAREKTKYGTKKETNNSINTSKIKGSFAGVDIKQRVKDVNRPGTQQLINKFTKPTTVTQKNESTQTMPKKKIKTKKKATTSTKRKPIISDEAFEKRAKAQGQKPRDGKTKGKKVNITDAQFNKRAKAQGQKPTDGKAPKVDKVLSKRELRLANVKRKAANEKTRTNKTAQSIDASKPKSTDTGAKQTSARRSRAKAKRLENRATRIQGRIDRKGKSSAEKRASRQAQRKKIKENR